MPLVNTNGILRRVNSSCSSRRESASDTQGPFPLHRHALVAQFENALSDELCLLVGVVTGDERRLHA
ncbi:MAG: hypothetical protein Ct9H300mP7_4230 [Verrucomicrobiota bacterium]|nr:MAG: hypothetical protein Ct9H300mP7_4230 [Verrucomicrobiota bacterium]